MGSFWLWNNCYKGHVWKPRDQQGDLSNNKGKKWWRLGLGPSRGGADGEKLSDFRYVSKLELTAFTGGFVGRWPLPACIASSYKEKNSSHSRLHDGRFYIFYLAREWWREAGKRLCILEPGNLSLGMFAMSYQGCSPLPQRWKSSCLQEEAQTNTIFFPIWLSVTSLSFS